MDRKRIQLLLLSFILACSGMTATASEDILYTDEVVEETSGEEITEKETELSSEIESVSDGIRSQPEDNWDGLIEDIEEEETEAGKELGASEEAAGNGNSPILMQASSSGHWEEQVVGYQYVCQCGACFPDSGSLINHQIPAELNGDSGHQAYDTAPIIERVWVEDPEPTPEPEPEPEPTPEPGKKTAQPALKLKLIAAYNGAHGVGVKWIKLSGATEYTIWQKYQGVWRSIKTVKPNDKSLQDSGNTLMYTDQTVKTGYGKGYIYSVSAKVGSTVVDYDKAGVAIYRLNPPTLKKATNPKAGQAKITWKGVFGKTETNGAYDLQYASEANAKAGKWTNAKKLPGFAHNVTSATVTGLKKGTKYIFRIRCSKTNKDRGTFYSEYSPWLSVQVKK